MTKEDAAMRKPLAPIAAAATGLCIGLSAAPVAAEQASGGGASTSHEADIDVQVPDSAERIGDYWTQDRMRAAKPMPTPRISRPSENPNAGEDAAEE